MPPKNPNLVYDVLTSFKLGIDSGVDIQDLPKNQCAFATSATFRGNYATNRPSYRKLTLSDSLDSVLQSALAGGVFQGATTYIPDGSSEQLACSIGGRQFIISPNLLGNSTGSEITIAGDANPATRPQCWITQAERWLVFQDGLSIPIFYDGVSSRRSTPSVSLIATTLADFSTPKIGGTATITLTSAYTGLLNSVLNLVEKDANGNILRTTNWIVTKVGGVGAQSQVVLKNLYDTGTTQPANTNLVIQPANLGYISSVSNFVTTVHGSSPNLSFVSTANIAMEAAVPVYVVVNNTISISGSTWKVTAISSDRITLSISRTASTPPPTLQTGLDVTLNNYNQPNVVVGSLANSFTVPAIGSNVNAVLNDSYTYADGQVLFLGTGQYQVVSHSTSQPAANVSITAENLNDDISTTIFAGSQFYNLPEIPTGRMMTYGMGRLWESGVDGITYLAGDIVGGSSGSPAFNGRDAVLKVTENTFLAGGGLFSVPSSGQIITGMSFAPTLDASLGQGALQIFTNQNVFSCNAPVDRATWAILTNPIETESLIGSGASSNWAISNSDADILFRCPNNALRSYIKSRLDFNRWGNTPISHEVERIISDEDETLMPFCSAVVFDNRWLVACNPRLTNYGVVWDGIIALDFEPFSSLQGKQQSVYDGLWDGLSVFQIVRFKNSERAFAFCLNSSNLLEIWELSSDNSTGADNVSSLIEWSFETPPMLLDVKGKTLSDVLKLENGELLASKISGNVDFTVEYKADFDEIWRPWHSWSVSNPTATPQYRKPMGFGAPPVDSTCNINTDLLPIMGDFFRLKITVTGRCVIDRIRLAASIQGRPDFYPPTCS